MLGTVVGGALVGTKPAPAEVAPAEAPQSDVVARATETPDPGELEGSSALAADRYVIPPPRWLKGRTVPGQPTEREHGTDGLVGWFPFRELYAASEREAATPPAPAHSVIFWNRKAGWQVDVYAR